MSFLQRYSTSPEEASIECHGRHAYPCLPPWLLLLLLRRLSNILIHLLSSNILCRGAHRCPGGWHLDLYRHHLTEMSGHSASVGFRPPVGAYILARVAIAIHYRSDLLIGIQINLPESLRVHGPPPLCRRSSFASHGSSTNLN